MSNVSPWPVANWKKGCFSAFCQNVLETVKGTGREKRAIRLSSLDSILVARDYHGGNVERTDHNAEFLVTSYSFSDITHVIKIRSKFPALQAKDKRFKAKVNIVLL
tara:strand:- start:356 stop:673 length:318 start_codon:yes stop_codon:yes gene_type:complete